MRTPEDVNSYTKIAIFMETPKEVNCHTVIVMIAGTPALTQ